MRWEALHPVQFSSLLLPLWFRLDPKEQNLPVSVLREGAGPRVLVRARGRGWGSCREIASCLPVGIVPAPARSPRPSRAEAGARSGPQRRPGAPAHPYGGQDPLPRAGNDNQGLLYRGAGFSPSHLIRSGFLLACSTPGVLLRVRGTLSAAGTREVPRGCGCSPATPPLEPPVPPSLADASGAAHPPRKGLG